MHSMIYLILGCMNYFAISFKLDPKTVKRKPYLSKKLFLNISKLLFLIGDFQVAHIHVGFLEVVVKLGIGQGDLYIKICCHGLCWKWGIVVANYRVWQMNIILCSCKEFSFVIKWTSNVMSATLNIGLC